MSHLHLHLPRLAFLCSLLLNQPNPAKLKHIIGDIEAGPEAGKLMVISSLREDQIRQTFMLGPDRALDIRPYKVKVPKDVSKLQFSSC
jgi:hypothetical protein